MERFRYEPFDLEKPMFRLLRLLKDPLCSDIRCELFQARIGDHAESIPYTALSYAWGSPGETELIIVNDMRMDVSRNLAMALLYPRYQNMHHDLVLWTDAICIDQDNIKERGYQVHQMKTIYRQAERVIFWLGEPTDQTDLVMDYLIDMQTTMIRNYAKNWDHQHWDELWSQIQPSYRCSENFVSGEDLRQGLQSLLDRPWFKRVWIIQEVANARAALVCCGEKAVWAGIFAISPSLIRVHIDPHCQAILDIMPWKHRGESWWAQDRRLYTLFEHFGGCEASDERDRIYALLGISSDANCSRVLSPDYTKTPQEVARDVIQFLYGFDMTTIPEEYLRDAVRLNFFFSDSAPLHRPTENKQSQKAENIAPSLLHLGQTVVEDFKTVPGVLRYLKPLGAFAACHHVKLSQKHELMEMFKRPKAAISKDTVVAAAKHGTVGKEMVEVLIQHQDFTPTFNRHSIVDVATSFGSSNCALLIQHYLPVIEQSCGVDAREIVYELLSRYDYRVSQAKDDDHLGTDLTIQALITARHLGVCKLYEGRSLLCHAQEKGFVNVVSYLMNCNEVYAERECVRHRPVQSQQPLHLYRPLISAVKRGSKADVERILASGIDVEEKDSMDRTLLIWAAQGGNKDLVVILLEKEADIEHLDGNLDTPLLAAARNGHESVVEELLKAGAQVDHSEIMLLATKEGQELIYKKINISL
ncbi:HET-domain-containing protein [Seiridium cupressi]